MGSTRHRLIVAGDWNILRGYGEYGSKYWKARYDTVFDRAEALGLRFVGSPPISLTHQGSTVHEESALASTV